MIGGSRSEENDVGAWVDELRWQGGRVAAMIEVLSSSSVDSAAGDSSCS